MRCTALAIGACLVLSSGAAAAPPAAGDPVAGLWLSENGDGTIEIYRTPAGRYEGRIVAGTNPGRRDAENPDPALRTRILVGSVIMQDMQPDGADSWSGGTIYDPDTGNTYRCRMRLDGDVLHLRGYLGISLFGRTSHWTRVALAPAPATPLKR